AAVTVGNENVAIGRDQRCGGRVELIRAAARDGGFAEPHQHLSVRAELPDLVALAVPAEPIRYPDVSVRGDREPVWKQYQAGAEALYQLAGLVEFEDRIEVGSIAGKRRAGLHLRGRRKGAAALRDPDTLAVRIDADARCRTPAAAFR